MEYIIEQLQSSVEGDLYPAGRLLDALPTVVRAPPLHEAQPQDTESPQIIHSHSFCQVRLNANVGTQVTCMYMYKYNAVQAHCYVYNIIIANYCNILNLFASICDNIKLTSIVWTFQLMSQVCVMVLCTLVLGIEIILC